MSPQNELPLQASRRQLMAQITERILDLLNQNIVPWKIPWSGALPYNYISRRPYGVLNATLLLATPFTQRAWLTQRQVERRGASILPQQKPTTIYSFFPNTCRRTNPQGEPSYPVELRVRKYQVWNIQQTTLPPPKNKITPRPIHTAEAIVQNMPKRPAIHQHPLAAYYRPLTDEVYVPPPDAFPIAEEYYSTLFHELVHATGHPSRLKRKSLTVLASFGSHAYSQEELVAELGSAYLCAIAGIERATLQNSVAYIQSWYRVLKNDPYIFPIAAAHAQRASQFILGRLPHDPPADPDAATTSTPPHRLVPATNADALPATA